MAAHEGNPDCFTQESEGITRTITTSTGDDSGVNHNSSSSSGDDSETNHDSSIYEDSDDDSFQQLSPPIASVGSSLSLSPSSSHAPLFDLNSLPVGHEEIPLVIPSLSAPPSYQPEIPTFPSGHLYSTVLPRIQTEIPTFPSGHFHYTASPMSQLMIPRFPSGHINNTTPPRSQPESPTFPSGHFQYYTALPRTQPEIPRFLSGLIYNTNPPMSQPEFSTFPSNHFHNTASLPTLAVRGSFNNHREVHQSLSMIQQCLYYDQFPGLRAISESMREDRNHVDLRLSLSDLGQGSRRADSECMRGFGNPVDLQLSLSAPGQGSRRADSEYMREAGNPVDLQLSLSAPGQGLQRSNEGTSSQLWNSSSTLSLYGCVPTPSAPAIERNQDMMRRQDGAGPSHSQPYSEVRRSEPDDDKEKELDLNLKL